MAVRFDAATDRLSYTGGAGNPPDPPYSVLLWVRIVVDSGTDTSLYRRYTSGGSSRGQIATSGNGLDLFWFPSGHDFEYSLTVAEFHRICAVVDSGGGITTYAAPESGPFTVRAGSAGTTAGANLITLAAISAGNGGQPLNGREAYVRCLPFELADETAIAAEFASATPVAGAAWHDWPLEVHTDLTDHSGNSRNLTAGASAVTTEAGPPLGATQAIVLSSEVDTARALGRAKTKTAGVGAESDQARTLGAAKAKTLGVVTGFDTARQLAAGKTLGVGPAAETGTARPLGVAKALTLATVVELDAAQLLPIPGRAPINPALEVGAARTLGAAKSLALGTVTEVDTASSFGRALTLLLPTVTEMDAPRALTASKALRLLEATERDTARAMTSDLVTSGPPPERTYVVPAESRVFAVPAENRVVVA